MSITYHLYYTRVGEIKTVKRRTPSIEYFFNDTTNITKKYNLIFFFIMTPTTIFSLEKVV